MNEPWFMVVQMVQTWVNMVNRHYSIIAPRTISETAPFSCVFSRQVLGNILVPLQKNCC